MPLPDLDLLVAVVESGSLTAASERLGMPRATLSRRFSALEEQMGARLIHRSNRQCTMTEAGQTLYERARSIVHAVEAARSEVQATTGEPAGVVRLSQPPGAHGFLAPILADFLERHPRVQIEVRTDARHVDLVAEGFDIAIRAGTLTGAGLVARRLMPAGDVAVASPRYLDAHGRPAHVADLVDHRAIVGFDRGEVPQRSWPTLSGAPAPVSPVFSTNDLQLAAALARRGTGIAMVPENFVQPELDAGELEVVLPGVVGAPGGVWLVYSERRFILARVRALVDHIAACARRAPMPRLD